MLEKEESLAYTGIESQFGHLKGKVLTVLDAVIEDERKLKASKDLVHQQFREQIDWIYQLCYGTSPQSTNQKE